MPTNKRKDTGDFERDRFLAGAFEWWLNSAYEWSTNLSRIRLIVVSFLIRHYSLPSFPYDARYDECAYPGKYYS